MLQALLPPQLHAQAGAVAVGKGQLLFQSRRRPTRMYFVVRGEVVLQRLDREGSLLVLQRIHRGLVAEASLQASAYHCDAVVTAAGEVVTVPIGALKEALTRDHDFAMRWIGMLGAELRRLRAQCERLSLKGVAERLLHLLQTEGVQGRLEVPSDLKSLAAELAVSHEALYRTLAKLAREGRIRRDAGALTLVAGR